MKNVVKAWFDLDEKINERTILISEKQKIICDLKKELNDLEINLKYLKTQRNSIEKIPGSRLPPASTCINCQKLTVCPTSHRFHVNKTQEYWTCSEYICKNCQEREKYPEEHLLNDRKKKIYKCAQK